MINILSSQSYDYLKQRLLKDGKFNNVEALTADVILKGDKFKIF